MPCYREAMANKPMTPSEYMKTIVGRAGSQPSEREWLILAALSLAGETGEVVDLLKKELYHNRPRDPERLLEECGDVLWSFTLLLHTLGFSYEQVVNANIAKLRQRYPDGFTFEDAAKRRDLDQSENDE